jgi:hypothetical protein
MRPTDVPGTLRVPLHTKEDFMGKPHEQEITDREPDDDEQDSENIAPHDLPPNLDDDDEYIDDWINHVDDFDNNDDVNNW